MTSAAATRCRRPDALVLGIETSCDETAAAVVRGGTVTLSGAVASQHELHGEYRGVVPEIASRAHAERILPIVRIALRDAGVGLDDIDAVAVGNRPGLIGALLVGVAAAKALAWSLGVPLIGVDHVRAHLYAATMDSAREPAFPAIGLVVSGGHTAIYLCSDPTSASRLGGTIDDAAGEAFDKAATILGAGYPGGPALDRLARSGAAGRFKLPIARLSRESLDFSFSGLKTAVLYAWNGVPGNAGAPGAAAGDDPERARRDLAADFERAVVGTLILKLGRALGSHPECRSLLVGGGVCANSLLRAELARLGEQRGLDVRIPRPDLCVDNAAMIAGMGHAMLEDRAWAGDGLDLRASPTGVR